MENKKLGSESAFGISTIRLGGNLEMESKTNKGMSKRLYIATAAMQGILASDVDSWIEPNIVARKAYEYTNELLKQENENIQD